MIVHSTLCCIALATACALSWTSCSSTNSENLRKSGDTLITTSGLKYIELQTGTGAQPESRQTVTVHYTGWLTNGQKFDSSFDRGKPLEFPIDMGYVIEGWDEGIMSMRVGGKRRLIIPPDLAYGSEDKRTIPPNSTLIFDVELLGVKAE